MQSPNFFLAPIALAVFVAACGGSQHETTTTTVMTRNGRHEVLRLRMNDEVRAACPGVQAPTFDFDSSDVEPSHRATFRPLAECMNLAANSARHIVLIGHTDPVGSANYNAQLGMDRATSVKDLLVSFGVAADRIEPVSRGEAGAQGSSPDEWPAERRVEIEFAAPSGS